MNGWIAVSIAYLVGLPAIAIALSLPAQPPPETLPLPTVAQAEPRWQERAEQAFRMPRGHGRYLTEREWREHQRTLWTLSAPEVGVYRAAVRAQLVARAASP
ncbi:MAG: hypothetical protein EHM24_31250, partial [Acidobacteria bacterium]